MKIIITQGETELTWTDLTSMIAVFRKYNSDPAGRLEGEGGGNRQFWGQNAPAEDGGVWPRLSAAHLPGPALRQGPAWPHSPQSPHEPLFAESVQRMSAGGGRKEVAWPVSWWCSAPTSQHLDRELGQAQQDKQRAHLQGSRHFSIELTQQTWPPYCRRRKCWSWTRGREV